MTGDPVNVSARLEQGAAPGEILVGERTADAARGAFEFGDPSMIEAKGKPEGVRCRRLVRALSFMRPRGVGGLARAFVGRDEELGRLSGAYAETLEHRRPRLVTVLGVDAQPDSRVLEERDLIRRRPGSSIAGEREYAIKHALTREVAYASLPKARRARLHAAFSAWLERLGEDREDLAALLAHHYSEAVKPEDADRLLSARSAWCTRTRSFSDSH